MQTTGNDRNAIARAKLIVIKLGSAVLTTAAGELDMDVLRELAETVSHHVHNKRQIIVVTSGAVAAGRGALHLVGKKVNLGLKQALASIGQTKLMGIYTELFAQHGVNVGQVLLTKGDMQDRRRYINIQHALEELLHYGCVPVINENDTTAVDELKFGDNDGLASVLAAKMQADALIILSDVNGLFDKNPTVYADALLVRTVADVTDELITSVVPPDTKATLFGTGGMASKLSAARYATNEGVNVAIGNGKVAGNLATLLGGGSGGTFFPAHTRKHNAFQQWLLGTNSDGHALMIDDGAQTALVERKKSLLPAGVRAVIGEFEAGDVVDIIDLNGKVLGRGITNYNAGDMTRIKGLPTATIRKILGERHCDEAIARNNLAMND